MDLDFFSAFGAEIAEWPFQLAAHDLKRLAAMRTCSGSARNTVFLIEDEGGRDRSAQEQRRYEEEMDEGQKNGEDRRTPARCPG